METIDTINRSIPKGLIEQIRSGNIVLFLGAGASFDSFHPENKQPPTGDELSELLARKFLDDKYVGKDLQYVSELAISETSLYDVQKFIYDIFVKYKAGHPHLKIPLFKWHTIFTTNYDLIIEDAYDQVEDRIQNISKIIKNGEKINHAMKLESALLYFKLHGCISEITDENLPLILSTDQYVDHLKNRDRLFYRLKDYCKEFPVLFIGYSLADQDIRSSIKELSYIGSMRPRSYMVGPGITDEEQRLWGEKKISSIKMTFKNFMEQLENSISLEERKLSVFYKKDNYKHPIHNKFISDSKEPTQSLLEFLEKDVNYIHSNIKTKDTASQLFYKGYFDGWDPIIKNLDVQRKLTEIILSEVFVIEEGDRINKQELFLIDGNAGSGKTVLLYRLAWEAGVTFDKLCLFYKSDTSIEYNRLIEVHELTNERVFLFIDNINERIDDVDYILNKARKDNFPLTVIVAERTNVWNIYGNLLSSYIERKYTLGYLNDDEINDLIILLERHKSLGHLSDKTFEEKREALSEKAGRELLVALYEATAGKPFPDIVLDEYKSIPDEEAKQLYLTICTFHRIGTYARAGNISRLHDINFNYFQEKLFKPLESVVYHKRNYSINDYIFLTRHQHIAELVFEQVLIDQNERFDKYVSIISKLDVDYESDRLVFINLTNAKKLMETFNDASKIRTIYQVAYEAIGDDSNLLQQQSIFEMKAQGGNFDTSEALLNKANELDPQNSFIAHSKAELYLRKAEKSTNSILIKQYLNTSEQLCKDILSFKKSKNHVHSYHTLLKIYLYELKLLVSTNENNTIIIENKVKDFEKTFNVAIQLFPNESFLLDAESNFNDLFNNSPKVLESLEKAFQINKRNSYIASRLSNYYKKIDIKKSKKVLEEALKFNPNDKELNYKYAKLLMEIESEDFINLKHYLRKSFLKFDKRYEAQFWYGRCLYVLNEDFKDYFEYLKNVPIDYRIKKEPKGFITQNGNKVIYEGIIVKVEQSYGFVKQNITGETLYFQRDVFKYPNLRINTKIKFNKAFNFNGPLAILI